ncbi:MAG: hypothetical protein BWY99_01778 [Synergistetes bacterium ADurb.BinA166]|nr:MAG: hypothetical protein BWY99_01778 [Synergistetes bacterium ADurb.BinA166]
MADGRSVASGETASLKTSGPLCDPAGTEYRMWELNAAFSRLRTMRRSGSLTTTLWRSSLSWTPGEVLCPAYRLRSSPMRMTVDGASVALGDTTVFPGSSAECGHTLTACSFSLAPKSRARSTKVWASDADGDVMTDQMSSRMWTPGSVLWAAYAAATALMADTASASVTIGGTETAFATSSETCTPGLTRWSFRARTHCSATAAMEVTAESEETPLYVSSVRSDRYPFVFTKLRAVAADTGVAVRTRPPRDSKSCVIGTGAVPSPRFVKLGTLWSYMNSSSGVPPEYTRKPPCLCGAFVNKWSGEATTFACVSS